MTRGALETGRGPSPGCRSWGAARGPRGPVGCGNELPGARESAWASGGAWRAGRLLWRSRSWSVARGHGEGGEGGARSGAWLPPPGLRLGGKESSVPSLADLPAALSASAAGFLSPGAARILFWGTWLCASRAAPAPRPGGQTGLGGGGGRLPGAGNGAERVARLPFLPQSLAPASCYGPVYSRRLPSPSFSNNLALRNSRKWGEITGVLKHSRLPPTRPDFQG